jgi:proteasome component ECM29
VETLQILQPMRTEGHVSLRRMMEKAKTSLLACLQEKFGESDSGREWRRRVEALQATT